MNVYKEIKSFLIGLCSMVIFFGTCWLVGAGSYKVLSPELLFEPGQINTTMFGMLILVLSLAFIAACHVIGQSISSVYCKMRGKQ
jgi:hypothetical protein